jgi:hypothetical protein
MFGLLFNYMSTRSIMYGTAVVNTSLYVRVFGSCFHRDFGCRMSYLIAIGRVGMNNRFRDNRNTFEQKVERLISLISRAVGLPSLARKARKYLVNPPDLTALPAVQMFDVEKVYCCHGPIALYSCNAAMYCQHCMCNNSQQCRERKR